jgi:hypothetical protein
MSIKLRRAFNAFILGTLATAGALFAEDYKTFTDSVSVGDWSSLATLGLALIGGAISGGIRYVQSSAPLIPSPEPEENPKVG